MKYKFKEANLGENFCKKQIAKIKELINSSTSFTVVGMPAMGISIFLRYLATRKFAYFIHVDIYELASPTKTELLKLLIKELGGIVKDNDYGRLFEQCKKELVELTKKEKRVAIVFNRFDQLQKEFDNSFFGNLRALRDIDKEKIVMIFSANKPLFELATQSFGGGNINMYSTSFYFEPYQPHELIKLLRLNSPDLTNDKVVLKKATALSGGHYQLLNLLLKSERLGDSLLDPFVKTQLKALYEHLNYHQQRQLKMISQNKKVGAVDQYLIDVGMVKTGNERLELFTPLLSKFVIANLPFKLPVKEQKLFSLLKHNLGKVVNKDEIFNSVWGENDESASDWALNALIYRLKKNLSLTKSGFAIENQKKVGYMLVKI